MAESGSVEFNDAEIQRILNSPQMAAEVRRVGAAIVACARAIAPVKSSDYINSFRVELKPHKQYRVVGYVINDSDHAMLVEMRHGTLSKARRAR